MSPRSSRFFFFLRRRVYCSDDHKGLSLGLFVLLRLESVVLLSVIIDLQTRDFNHLVFALGFEKSHKRGPMSSNSPRPG